MRRRRVFGFVRRFWRRPRDGNRAWFLFAAWAKTGFLACFVFGQRAKKKSGGTAAFAGRVVGQSVPAAILFLAASTAATPAGFHFFPVLCLRANNEPVLTFDHQKLRRGPGRGVNFWMNDSARPVDFLSESRRSSRSNRGGRAALGVG